MGLIKWPDGLERVAGHKLRQYPQKHVWSSTLWSSRRGELFRRYFNPVDRTFSWSDPLELAVQECTGRMGLHITARFVPIETIICSAWRSRANDSYAKVRRVGPRREITAKHLRWSQEEEHDEAEIHDAQVIDGEVWRKMTGKCGVISCKDLGYEISNKGRLRNPDGNITRGFIFANSRWAAIKGGGLVDLHVVAGISDAPQPYPPCVKDALYALMSGHTPEEVQTVTSATVKSIWSYFSRAVEFADPSDLKLVWTLLVPKDLSSVLKRLKRAANPSIGGPLTDLHQVVSQRLPLESATHDDLFLWEKLRFARGCVIATMQSQQPIRT